MKKLLMKLWMLTLFLLFPLSVNADSGKYIIEATFYNVETNKKISLPSVDAMYFNSDGTEITTNGSSAREYYDVAKDYLIYESLTKQPTTMVIDEDSIEGWILENEIVLEWIDVTGGTGGQYIASPKIYLKPDTSISKVDINASITGEITAGIEMVLRQVDSGQILQTVYTDENGIANFKTVEMGEYAVYCPKVNRGWYISSDLRGEVSVEFSKTYKTSYSVTYKDRFNSDVKNFLLKVTNQKGEEITILKSGESRISLSYAEGGNEQYYISTESVPEGYSGNVENNVLIIPYDNRSSIYINPDIEQVLQSIRHKEYNGLNISNNYELNVKNSDDLQNVLDSYVQGIESVLIRFVYSGTDIVADYAVDIPAEELTFSDIKTNVEKRKKLFFEYFEEEDSGAVFQKLIETGTLEFSISTETEYGKCKYNIHSTSEKETYSDGENPFVWDVNVKVSGNSVELNWGKPNKFVNHYIVNRIDSNGKLLFSDKTKTTSYTDKGLTAGKTYYYRIDAVYYEDITSGKKSVFESAEYSAVIKRNELGTPVTTLSNKASTGKNIVSWKSVTNAKNYQVYRATSKTGTYSLVKTITGTSYTDTKATAGKIYYYKVRAVSADGTKGSFSNIKSRVCDCGQPVITLSNIASTGKIKVSWGKIAGATSYKVYRSTSKNGKYSHIKTSTGAVYTDTNVIAGKTYYYKVKALSNKSTSATSVYSKIKSRVCDLKRPVVKISLKNNKPRISWSKVAGAKSYQVYRATSKNGKYGLKKTTSLSYYRDSTAKKGTTYYYKVIAVSNKTSSANSSYSTTKYIKSK